ncbi:purine-nucleoside phosphorylase [Endozoicomonas sp.]|nr:purine-nucleoside phosphorylase [Endozoicomonas sp.]
MLLTPHINARPGSFADVCLMPVDPLRAKYIAKHFLEGVELVNDVRNMLGYTGYYKDRKISVMGSGMGIPSASIYYKELITDYGVDKIIRLGSCGSVFEEVELRDMVFSMGACTDSIVNRIRFKNHDFSAIADFDLLEKAVSTAREKKLSIHVGNVFSTDLFYAPEQDIFDLMERRGVLAVEMETAGLYGICAEYGAKGLSISMVSENIRRGEILSEKECLLSFNEMVNVALTSIMVK